MKRMGETNRETLVVKTCDALKKDIGDLREWLGRLEEQVDEVQRGVISAVLINSIGECCTRIAYNVGKVNGAMLCAVDPPTTTETQSAAEGGEVE